MIVKMWLDIPDYPTPGYKFCGHHFKYPSEEEHLGLVSMVSDDPPAMHWIYVDKDSHSVQHGSRTQTVGHVIGPWSWSEDERFVTLHGDKDSFIAVKFSSETATRWAVFWDPEHTLREEIGPEKTQSILLHRKLEFGMESRYVRA